MKNRFYTLMLVPEKTDVVRRVILPTWLLRAGFTVLAFGAIISAIMILDYWHVLSQIDENKELKIENRRLQQEVQIFKNRIETIDATMDRIKTFENRLRIITNLEERDDLAKRLNRSDLPDSATNTGAPAKKPLDPDALGETLELTSAQRKLDQKLGTVHGATLGVEEEMQDLYELLIDQKAFLLALPTRKPSIGYFTSGFGVRRTPFGGEIKMHEGLDIANYPGTPIFAPANGLVQFAGLKPGYGRTVILDHGYGLETWYGHTQKTFVNRGERIGRGTKIAQIGNTGRSTGPHVHYEVRVNGIPVDPLSYILED